MSNLHFEGNLGKHGGIQFPWQHFQCFIFTIPAVYLFTTTHPLQKAEQFLQLDIASSVVNFSINNTDRLIHIIPGEEVVLNITAIDDLNQTHAHDVVYEAFMTGPSNSIEILICTKLPNE